MTSFSSPLAAPAIITSRPPAIVVDHVSKQFDLSANAFSFKTIIIDRFLHRPKHLFTALSDVSFTVAEGETLGLIGANGAGKSTLLSIIAGTIAPTSGHVSTRGTVSSLLELGAGFHPDLTGRENVFLYGSIMGIPRETMKKRFDAIVDFSGLHEFIDQPVRFYSSGMYVRLGFSVAVQVDPDVLLIDEVLAVGDADFQKKCIDKMADFRRMGKSMLIISHDLGTIQAISDRILFLTHGVVTGLGQPEVITEQYKTSILGEHATSTRREWGNGEARITATTLVDLNGNPIDTPPRDHKLHVRVDYHASKPIPDPVFGFSIEDADGHIRFASDSQRINFHLPSIEGDGSLLLELDASTLQGGAAYTLSFNIQSTDRQTNYHHIDHAIPVYFEKTQDYDGILYLPAAWKSI